MHPTKKVAKQVSNSFRLQIKSVIIAFADLGEVAEWSKAADC
jgi:hypothetical protein